MSSKKAAARQKQREEKETLQAENEQLKEQLKSMNDNMATILDELKQLKASRRTEGEANAGAIQEAASQRKTQDQKDRVQKEKADREKLKETTKPDFSTPLVTGTGKE